MKEPRPALENLCCLNAQCKTYGQRGQANLRVRKTYGADRIRYLRWVNYCRLKADSFLAYARPYCVHVDGQRPAPGLVQDIYGRIHVAV